MEKMMWKGLSRRRGVEGTDDEMENRRGNRMRARQKGNKESGEAGRGDRRGQEVEVAEEGKRRM